MPVDAARLASLFGAESVGAFEPGSGTPAELDGVPVVSPPSIEAACEVLRFAARDAHRVLPAGSGEHLDAGVRGRRPDLVLSTRRMSRIVEYEPDDMVLVAEAGATLGAIEERTAAEGQRLGPDPWPGRGATVGGAAAMNRCGPGRLRYGSWRDAVLGARVVHADGRISKSGGKVVKNVAGYDLAKLYVGSRGSLALLAELDLRLVPRPAASALVLAELDRARAAQVLLALDRAALAPSALLLVAGDILPGLALGTGRAAACALFEGDAASVRWQVGEASRLAGGEEWPEERAAAARAAVRAFGEPAPGTTLVRISSLPARVPAALESLIAGSGAVWREGAAFVGQIGVGTSLARLAGVARAELAALQSGLGAQGMRLEVAPAPPGLASPLAALDPVLLDLLQRTKLALDPEERFPALVALGGAA